MAKSEPKRVRRNTIGIQRLPKWAQDVAQEDSVKLTGVALADWYLTLQRGRDLATARDLSARIDAVGGMVAALGIKLDGIRKSSSIEPTATSPLVSRRPPAPLDREPWEEQATVVSEDPVGDVPVKSEAYSRVAALLPEGITWQPGEEVGEQDDVLVLSIDELDDMFQWLQTQPLDVGKAIEAVCTQARGWRPNPDQAGSLLKTAPWLVVPTKNPQGLLEGNLRRLSIMAPQADPHGVEG